MENFPKINKQVFEPFYLRPKSTWEVKKIMNYWFNSWYDTSFVILLLKNLIKYLGYNTLL